MRNTWGNRTEAPDGEMDRAMKRAFLRLYASSETRITVRRLCEETPAARTTFYAHFDYLQDLQQQIEDGLLTDLLSIRIPANMPACRGTLEDHIGEVLRFIENNWEANYAFLVARPNGRYIGAWKDAIRDRLSQRAGASRGGLSGLLLEEAIPTALLSAYRYWLRNPQDVDALQVGKTCLRLLHALRLAS